MTRSFRSTRGRIESPNAILGRCGKNGETEVAWDEKKTKKVNGYPR